MYRTLYSPQGGRIILDGREVINMASNNYLGLANHPAVVAAAKEALEKYGVATTASRNICGNYPVHDELEEKLAEFNVEVVYKQVLDDKPEQITAAIKTAIEEKGAEMVLCTGGMSVDPDDRTPLAIKNTGASIVSYGAPVLPGAMFLLSYYGEKQVPVLGLPGCVMYAKRTVFDLVLPRVLACDLVTADELAALGEGGLCLNCAVCTYPACGFGKGW